MLDARRVPADGGVVVDGEDADGAAAALAVDDFGLAGQAAVAVDADVDAGADDVAVAEELGGFVVDGDVGEGAARQPREDEGRVDARIVGEGGDGREIDAVSMAVSA